MTIALTTDIQARLTQAFQERMFLLNSESSQPFYQLQKKAFSAFSNNGFPSIRQEEWKYCPVFPHLKEEYMLQPLPPSTEKLAGHLPTEKVNLLLFLNGRFLPQHSHILDQSHGLVLGSLAEARKLSPRLFQEYFGQLISTGDHPFADINTAFCEDGLFIHIPEKCQLRYPVWILHFTASEANATWNNPRHLIIARKNSIATLFEWHQNLDHKGSMDNIASEIFVLPNATIHHIQLTDRTPEARQIQFQKVSAARDSNYHSYCFQLGGKLIRHDLRCRLIAENADVNLFGAYLPSRDQLIDNHTVVDHKKPHAHSNELYKGIMQANGTAVFNGKIFVRPDAQKTNAYQTNRNLLLDTDSAIYTKPQLEIWADDVKCSHGTTTGQIDEKAIFYLRSRGISEAVAKKMILEAFVLEIAALLPDTLIRAKVEELISKKIFL